MRKLFPCLVTLLLGCTSIAQVSIIPKPASMKVGEGMFKISAATKIVVPKNDLRQAAFLNDYLKKFYGLQLATTTKAGANTIVLI